MSNSSRLSGSTSKRNASVQNDDKWNGGRKGLR